MPQLTVAFGVLLIIVGVSAYFGTGRESLTSLLPSVAGIPILLAGLAATRSEWNRYGLYAATGLAAILALGTLRGVLILVRGDVTSASVINTGLFIISVVFVIGVVSALRRAVHPQEAE